MRLRILRPPGPQDVADAADRRILRMDAGDGFVQQAAHDGREAKDLARRELAHVAVVLLRLHDGVEIAAIGDVEGELADARAVDRHAFGVEIARHIGEPHRFDIFTIAPVRRLDQAGGRIESQQPLIARRHQPALEGDRHGSDGAMPAHRQAAAGLDEDVRQHHAGLDLCALGRRNIFFQQCPVRPCVPPGRHFIVAAPQGQAGMVAQPIHLLAMRLRRRASSARETAAALHAA